MLFLINILLEDFQQVYTSSLASLVAQTVKNPPAMQETRFCKIGKIPWRRKGQPTPVFFLENSTDRGAWRAIVPGLAKSQTRLNDQHFHNTLTQQIGESNVVTDENKNNECIHLGSLIRRAIEEIITNTPQQNTCRVANEYLQQKQYVNTHSSCKEQCKISYYLLKYISDLFEARTTYSMS